MFKKLLCASFALGLLSALGQTTFYNLNSLQKIEISFSQTNWDYQMDTAKAGKEGYIMAQWVKVNGVKYDSVGVKYKGNSSYNPSNVKNPLHIELDTYKNQDYQGFTDIKLGNGYADPSMIREVLSYDILKNYMHCPRANFAQVYINGSYIGVYSNAESITKKFCADHFYSSNGVFFKCNPIVNPGPSTKSNLRTIPTAIDSSAYNTFYELKSKVGWNDLVALTNTVTTFTTTVGNAIDMDRAIWMLAFNNALVNLDSYSGVFAQNYYLYKDGTNHYNPIVWDLNMCFGGFPFLGSGNTSLGNLTIAMEQTLAITAHQGDQYWPLINDVLGNPMYRRMYVAHMKTIMDEMIVSNAYTTTAASLQATIDTALAADPFKFYTHTQFQNGMSANYSVGSYSVPGISTLMNARAAYLYATPDFTYTAPSITNVVSTSTAPALNSTVTITANVTNANSNAVYLGYRFITSDKFTRILMYDDGAHGDGAAGDNVFGSSFVMGGAQAQYYIYAENSNAGKFSPQRAEHEYYSLIGVQTAVPGQVKINELLADNVSDVKNESFQYEDWIELYNTTSNTLDLGGLYLTDDYSDKTKFVFPANTFIAPGGYLIVWADQNASTSSYIHCNFKLGAGGERIMLSNASGAVLDSISFGPQTADKSYARCPDGTGSFTVLPFPTFKALNCPVGIDEQAGSDNYIAVYPNPAHDNITVFVGQNKIAEIEVLNSLGQLVHVVKIETSQKLNTQSWSEGIYFIRSGASVKKIIIAH